MLRFAYWPLLALVGLLLAQACTESSASPTSVPVSQATATASPTPMPPPTATPTPTVTPTPVPAAAVSPLSETSLGLTAAQEILVAAYAAMRDVESFHFDLDARARQSGEGIESEIPMTFVGDVFVPDRVRGTLRVSLGFFELRIETIAIGDTAYMRDPQTGDWAIAPDLLSALPDRAHVAKDHAPSLEDLTLVGEKVLDGVTLYHLTGVVPKDALDDQEDDVEISFWIGVEDLAGQARRDRGE